MYNNPLVLLLLMDQVQRVTMENENVKKFINDPKQEFDLVLAEYMYGELYAGFAAIYDCPLIWSLSIEPHWMILSLIDEYTNAAYTPDSFSFNTPPFSIYQRFREVFMQLIGTAIRELYIVGSESKIYEEFIVPAIVNRGKQAPSFNDVKYNASMVLANSHVSLGVPIKLPQNFKYIGGYHINRDVKPLPQDLKKLMDSANNGVIYFSMGSNLKSKDMPTEMKQNLLKLFGSLNQTVLWKFEESLPDLPKNVHILNWAPQQSILSHPNIRIFITHGGYLSTNEAVYFGVPIIGLPVFGDQFQNAERAVKQGFAIKVDLTVNVDVPLKTAIETMVTDPKYTQKVKELSALYHDRPMLPGQELVYWVEYVVRTRGAVHLRSPALHTPLYQKMYLDLIAVTLIGLYAIRFVVKKFLFKKLRKTTKDKTH